MGKKTSIPIMFIIMLSLFVLPTLNLRCDAINELLYTSNCEIKTSQTVMNFII